MGRREYLSVNSQPCSQRELKQIFGPIRKVVSSTLPNANMGRWCTGTPSVPYYLHHSNLLKTRFGVSFGSLPVEAGKITWWSGRRFSDTQSSPRNLSDVQDCMYSIRGPKDYINMQTLSEHAS
jgi:hypothetical protein